MYRLIIVDNEPNIVRGIKLMLEEEAPFELDVYGAFSSEEALNMLTRQSFDIALLDIRMPGMNGIELQERIKCQWPRCRIVFLTGYDDFAYAQAALRGGSVDYILKTDGDEAIVQAIGKAINELSQVNDADRLLEQARDKLRMSMDSLQRDYVRQLANGLATAHPTRFAELSMPLEADRPALPVIGRVDGWPGDYKESDKTLLDYAIQNIVGECWTGSRFVCVSPSAGQLIAFLQPNDFKDEKRWVLAVHGQLEAIQSACRSYLRLPVSFVSGSRVAAWVDIPAKYAELRQILFFGFGERTEMLLTDEVGQSFRSEGSDERLLIHGSNKLRQLLASEPDSESRLRREFEEFADLSRQLHHRQTFLYELYNGLSYLLLSYANRIDIREELSSDARLEKLMSLEAHATWEEALRYLRETLEILLAARDKESAVGANAIVAKLKAFIETHLDEDLSLLRLSEIVYLNPTYLSRLFKQQAGIGVSQYITECRLNRAKDLLRDARLKIHEIALKTGFDSATSFGRFFKRELNVTPQEYRDRS